MVFMDDSIIIDLGMMMDGVRRTVVYARHNVKLRIPVGI
jgi:hypothetical protein